MQHRLPIGPLLRVLVLLVAALPLPGHSIDWESLVMPGPVVEGHAETEKSCKKCHAPFARDEQRALCLDCHKDIAGDLAGKSGFHWRSEPARTGQCRNCHTDHEGRGADIVRLTPHTFDHRLTDFPLQGGHQRVTCVDCHATGKQYREAPQACVGCHAEQDVHGKALGDDCAACHKPAGWRETRFDHAAATDQRYPLTGAHQQVDCGLCHAGQRFKDTPTRCVACHQIDDAHNGQRGADCGACHTTDRWKESTFDHGRKTGFALTAGHDGLACGACHKSADFSRNRGNTCVDCHRSDDAHQGRNGPKCATCHTTRAWDQASFDHAKATRFPLAGAHQELGCVACHKGEAKAEKLEPACVSCHRGDDPHDGALGTGCADCHGEQSWTTNLRFDHDLTGFPLVGLHATAACSACHGDRQFKAEGTACVDCHQANDVHKGGLGEACADCHTPNDWRIWTFDHAARTGFGLTGAHADVACVACHARPPGDGGGTSRDCGTCHRRDDIHGGQFGRDCARCHNTRTFTGAKRTRP